MHSCTVRVNRLVLVVGTVVKMVLEGVPGVPGVPGITVSLTVQK